MQQRSSIQKVIRDFIDLWELQIQLLSVDSQAAKQSVAKAIGCAFAALLLTGTGLTVALLGAGFLLDELTQLSTGAALLLIGGATLAIVLLLLFVAWRSINSASAAMSQSKSELAENLRWLKATLVAPQSSPRNQFRRESFVGPDHHGHRYSNSEPFYPHSPR
ncbi:phage holin family protein [Rhodopirellula sp. JC639]|uniref:phage holin family protein n=1 Tax=Stieleria mannarensis TaxID=2755585 RepID=UPI0016012A24|nr:phage holin family protein [Rhodopirellula sp. JC639]